MIATSNLRRALCLTLALTPAVMVAPAFTDQTQAFADTEQDERIAKLFEDLAESNSWTSDRYTRALVKEGPVVIKPLTELLLRSRSRHRRQAILNALGDFGTAAKDSLPAVIKTSRSSDRLVRISSIHAIRKLDPVKATDVYLAHIDWEQDVTIRRYAIEQLGYMGEQAAAAIPTLIKIAADPNERRDGISNNRLSAIHALADMGAVAKDAIPTFIKLVADPLEDSTVRRFAARALGRMGEAAAAAVPTLEKIVLEPRENYGVRDACFDALRFIGEPAIDALLKTLDLEGTLFDHWEGEALKAIADTRTKGARAFDRLKTYFENEDNTYRRGLALRAMTLVGRLEEDKLLPVVRGALAELDRSIRTEALKSVYELGNRAAPLVPEVARMVTDSNASIRRQALRALSKVNKAADVAVPLLIAGLDDTVTYVRKDAAAGLARLKKDALPALDALRKRLDAETSSSVRRQLVKTIAKLETYAPTPTATSSRGAAGAIEDAGNGSGSTESDPNDSDSSED